MTKKKGRDIAELICRVLKEHDIEFKNCRGQGYDNGANMAGVYNGAQAAILEKNPQALFSPCSAHSLNLCGVHGAESSAVVKSFFGNIQRLYTLFSSSPSRWKILQEAAGVSLHKLSTTRWSARIEAVKPLVKRPREILNALKGLRDHDLPGDVCNDVENLIQWLQSLEFVLLITFWFKVLQTINDVSVLLQGSKITIDEELRLIESLKDDLKRVRESWSVISVESKLVASSLGLSEHFREKRRRTFTRFHDEPRDSEHEQHNHEREFQINVFNVALDRVISEIGRRFEKTKQVNDMFSFLWNLSKVTSTDDNEAAERTIEICCKNLSNFYPRDLNEQGLLEEMRILERLQKSDILDEKLTSIALLNKVYEKGLQTILPQVCVALRLFVCIPVSVSSGERSFSKLGIVKNCRRSTMGQERLSSLIMLSCERDIARKINYDDVIESFAFKCARKASL